MKRQVRILLIDGEPGFLTRFGKTIRESNDFDYVVEVAPNADRATTLLARGGYHIALIDESLCGNEYELLRHSVSATPAIPPVLLTCSPDPASDTRAFNCGAVDALCKDELDPRRLDRLVRHALRQAAISRELSSLKHDLRVNSHKIEHNDEVIDRERHRREDMERRLEAQDRDYAMLFEKYRAIYENAVEGIFQTSPEGRIMSGNPALAAILGYPDLESLLANVKDLAHTVYADPARRQAFLDLMKRDGRTGDFEVEVRRRDGSIAWLTISARSVHDDTGRLLFFEGSAVDITQRKEAEIRLIHEITHDALTGLPNRGAFIDETRLRLDSNRPDFALALLDMDAFRIIIESLGHRRADRLLVEMGRRLAMELQAGEMVSRPGGDDFMLIVPETREETVRARLKGLQRTLSWPLMLGNRMVVPSLTIGVTFGHSGAEPEDLLREASAALEAARRRGRGMVEFFRQGVHGFGGDRLALEEEIRRGLERGEFEVYYQPIVNLRGGHITGYESLIRWNHPARGILLPSTFIQAAEDSGLIHAMGDFTVRSVLAQHRIWRLAGHEKLVASVNFSVRQLMDPELPTRLEKMLRDAEMPPQCLRAEITESIELDASEQVSVVVQAMARLGIRLAMDDFGTGYSSLGNLKKYRFSTLKIDRAFVMGLPDNLEDQSVVRAILSLARNLNLDVVAEGVETPEQAEYLLSSECASSQGYFHGRPMTAAGFSEQLSAAG